jgi:hypothetical protein
VKRALINSLLVAAAVVVSAPVFAQAVASDTSHPRTRAEVKAELIAAQRSGEYQAIRVDADSYPQLIPYRTHSRRTPAGPAED